MRLWNRWRIINIVSRKINVYCGWWRTKIVKRVPLIIDDVVLQIPCLECHGTGIFDCGIEEQRGMCIQCKGTGKQFLGSF